MNQQHILKIHPEDNIIVALRPFKQGEVIELEDLSFALTESIPIKHKFAAQEFQVGDTLKMYGVTVGKAKKHIPQGSLISLKNTLHATTQYELGVQKTDWKKPDSGSFQELTFEGYYRADGKVGTMNYWLVIPLVFCENRNLEVIKSALLEQLGYPFQMSYKLDVAKLVQHYQQQDSTDELLDLNIIEDLPLHNPNRLFPNVDGIKFLSHQGGCGGIRQDSETLCHLLAGYIANPNVAGATVLSLGCQNAQVSLFQEALKKQSPDLKKPVYILEQQQSRSEPEFIADAVKRTFVGLIKANKTERKPAPLSQLTIGLECGGSDGFSGISANPVLGYTSDLLVSLGGTAILSEFPELNGVEQELIARCVEDRLAQKFSTLMNTYAQRAEEVGSGFDMNPSPGNIKDGLITDAMKSAGAAKKGGTSPIQDVLDYTEIVSRKGLNLLCTPGNDVESTTGLAGSGANIILFTTGLGTPTGNPIAPTIKVASNTTLAERMSDIIDFDTGSIIRGEDTIQSKGENLLHYIIQVASGKEIPAAVKLHQDDFIPWKRGISL